MRRVCRLDSAFVLGVCLLGLTASPASLAAQVCITRTPIGTGNDFGTDVAIQPDGRIVVGGYYVRPIPERNDMAALRYNVDLRLDATFDSDGIATMDIWGNDHAYELVIQPNGQIVLGGTSNQGGQEGCCDQFSVSRFDSNGSFDAGFGPPNGHVTTSIGASWDLGYTMAVQTDGQIVVGGIVTDGSGNWNLGLIRYNGADGTLDPAFNPGGIYGIAPMNQSMVVYSVNPGDDYGNHMLIQPDGKILLAGATWNGTDWDWYIARFMPDGALDGTFGTGGIVTTDLRGFDDWGTSIALQPDGKIVFGSKSNSGTDIDFAVARYNADGTLDATFGTGGMVFTPIGSGDDDGKTVTLQPDGKIVLVGWYWNGTDEDFAMVRYNSDGSLDTSFGSGGIVTTRVDTGQDRIHGVTVQADGKLVVAGDSDNGSDLDIAVARYNPDGTLDQSCARYRSTGTSAVDLTAGSRTVEITNTTATFDGPVPDNIGVGDVLQYQVTGTYYLAVIHGRVSNTVYTVFATNGATPQAAAPGTAVEIFRAYTSLAQWELLDENDSFDNTVEDFDTSTDLVAAGTVMSVACYADGPDGPVTIDGWNTSASSFIRVYTPVLPGEVGVSQRHAGIWDNSKFRVENGTTVISVGDEYVRIDGLQVRSTADVANYAGIEITNGSGPSDYEVSNSIIRGVSGTQDIRIGLNLFLAGSGVLKAWNNLIYDWDGSPNLVAGIIPDDPGFTFFLSNNTVVDNYTGIDALQGTVIAKNNLVYNSIDNYAGAFDASGTNNLSGPAADGDMPPTNARNGVAVTFVNTGVDDFHLAGGDTGALGFGFDLSGDANLSFTDDIDSGLRTVPWDIGADEAAAALGTLTLQDHDLVQVGDRFGATTPVTDVLFRFRLTSTGTVNVDTLRLNFTTGSGVADADVTNAELYVDVDNDGALSGPDTPVQTGVSPSGGVITFTTNFPTAGAGTNYIVRATVDNLFSGDSTTFSLDATGIDTVELGVVDSGTISNAVHVQDATPGLLLSDHAAGQLGDRFTTTTAVTDVLFQFALTPSGVFDVTELRVNFTTGSGVISGDVTSAELWHDVNGNGIVDGPDASIQGGINGIGGALTFTASFTPDPLNTNYIVHTTVSNLAAGDFTTISLADTGIDLSAAVPESGTISNAVHAQDPASCSPAFNYLTNATDVTPSVANSWEDVDVSSSVPAGATGVIVQWQNANNGGVDYDYGLRKKGSTDAFFPSAAKSQQQQWVMIGLDANRAFQVYQGDTSDVKTWLIGYTMSGVTFFDNAIDKSLGTAAMWLDVNISADTGADTAIGAIFVAHNTSGSSRMFGLRNNGSTDNRVTDLRAETITAGIIGVDGGEIAEMNIEDLSVDLYLVGYVTSGAVFFTNAADKSTATTGMYVDTDITPDIGGDDANGAILEISPSDSTRRLAALRTNGATYDLYEDVSHGFAAIGVDAGNLFEQKIELDTMDVYLVGYTLGSCAAPTTTTNYRSIGSVPDYMAGDLSATSGSTIVVGNVTFWQTANRGQGDRIEIDGIDYTIFGVDTNTQITLTEPFAGVTGSGKGYTISRQFSTLQGWEDCISGAGGCAYFPVVGGDLVSDDRAEVGVAYDDGPTFAGVRFDGTNTDASHDITLTVATGNRHLGIAGQGVVLDNSGGALDVDAVGIRDEFVTVEWLEITSGNGAGADALDVRTLGASNKIVLRNNLVHDLPADGIFVDEADLDLDAYNNIIYKAADDGIHIFSSPVNGPIRLSNNTIYSCTDAGIDGVSTDHSMVLLQNNIAHSNGGGDFQLPLAIDLASRNNLSGDGSATAYSPSGGDRPGVALANVQFVEPGPCPPACPLDLHIVDGSLVGAQDGGADLSAIFSFDIDGGARQLTWDIGADDVAATTAVSLLSFEARALDGGIELLWETGTELDNLGFHVYRAANAAGPYERLTSSPIPGLGNSPVGARYSYRDAGLVNGATYFYELEDIETTGLTKMHGPVSATPEVGATPPADGGSSEPGETTRVTYGDPSANALRVLRQGESFIELELITEGFHAIPQDDGTVALDIPGFDLVGEAGLPSLPAMHHWVDAVAGRKVELRKVKGRMEPVTASWAVSSVLQELVADTAGTVVIRKQRRRVSVNAKGLFPSQGARLVIVGFQGESKKALVELAPLRWRADTGQLFLTRRLVVRLSFQRVDNSELTIAGRGGRRRARKFDRTHGVLARLATVGSGLYGVRYESIFGADGSLLSRDLRLARQGSSVPFHVEPDPARFGPGATLFFLSEGADANPYGNEAVFELSVSGRNQPSVQMATAADDPVGLVTPLYWKTVSHEVNQYYQPALLEAPDLWLWDLLLAPVTKSYPFQVSALAGSVESARLVVALQGTSDTPAAPDHHVRVYLNGTFLTEETWNGKTPRRISADIGPGLLGEGDNFLEIENVGDTGASYSTVMLDKFEVTYPRQLIAESGELRGAWSESGTASITGVGSAPIVLDTTESPRWLRATDASFTAAAGRSYLVVDATAVRAPEVRRPSLTSLARRRNQADYIVLGPRAFVEAAEPLLVHRAEQGLVVKSVAIEDVFDEFGHGESSPEAIRNFLAYAYHDWKAPSPRYVLLLGDASYDFKDYAQLGAANPVPPLMVKTSYLWTASDPMLAAVNGDDILPDLAIGRLPAASVEEVHAMVGKILAWESVEYGLDGPVVLVADNPDLAGDFAADAESAAQRIPYALEQERLYLGELGTTATRDGIIDAFDVGASLMTYIGHGGIHLWADENVFNTSHLSSLAPQTRQPLLLTMNCLNGYFHFPYFGSLSEELLKIEDKGVIAAFSPSGLSLNTPAQRLHHAMLDELFSGTHTRLGDAVLEAQKTFLESGSFPELLSIYHVLGDPALQLRSHR